MDLRDLISYHQLVMASEGLTEPTRDQYLQYHREFLAYLDSRAPCPYQTLVGRWERRDLTDAEFTSERNRWFGLDALNPATLRECVEWYLQRRDVRRRRGGEVGAQRLVAACKRLGEFGYDERVYAGNPVQRVKRRKVAKVARLPFSQAEINALWAASQRTGHPLRDEAILLLLLDTGMRAGELAGLRLSDVRLEQRQLVVGSRGKSRRDRLVPFGSDERKDGGKAVRSLVRYIQARPDRRNTDRLFLSRWGEPMTGSGVHDLFQRMGRNAGVEHSHPHRTRHTFCTNYLTLYPGDELGLRRIVGHLAHDVLADYVHFAQTVIQQRAGRASIADTLLGTPTMVAALRVAERERSASRLAASRRPASVRPWGQDHE